MSSAVYLNERKKLAQDAVILLYDLDYSRLMDDPGNAAYIYYFTDAVASGGEPIRLNSVLYVPLVIAFSGAKVVTQGTQPRPTIRVTEYTPGAIQNVARALYDLKGARLRRRRIYRRHLDDGSEPDPSALWYPYEEWIVNRRLASDRQNVEFQLAVKGDLEDVTLPGGRIEHGYCPHVYGPDRGPDDPALCSWVPGAGPYFKADDTPTANPTEDACGFRYQSCKLRFTARNQPMDFGGFPGVQRIAQPASKQ